MGGDLPGFFGVLHTLGRTLEYHPHIHCIATGGAFSGTHGTWHPSRVDFYLPVRVLSKIFRAKFRDEMEKAGLLDQIPHKVQHIDWVINSRAAGSSEANLKYLAPYVFRVAISNNRILSVENRTVTFRYRKPRSTRWRGLALEVMGMFTVCASLWRGLSDLLRDAEARESSSQGKQSYRLLPSWPLAIGLT